MVLNQSVHTLNLCMYIKYLRPTVMNQNPCLSMDIFWFIAHFVMKCFGYSHIQTCSLHLYHDDVIKWTHFPRYWTFVLGIHRSSVSSPHKGQWRGALMFSLIYAWMNCWVNNGEAGDLRPHRAHYDVTVSPGLWTKNYVDAIQAR